MVQILLTLLNLSRSEHLPHYLITENNKEKTQKK